MKKEMDKLKSKIKTSKKFTIFLAVLLLVGVISGTLFITILSSTDKSLVREYLNSYMSSIEKDKINYLPLFCNSFFKEFLVAGVIWLLGISIVGIPAILFLFFKEAFVLGFSIGSLLFVYKGRGLLYALFYIFPCQILNVIAYGLLLTYALSVSMKMIEAVFKHKTLDFKTIMSKYSKILGIVLLLFLVSSLLETFLLPNILKWILSFFK
ncbi:MAG: stage II sporulation protein M [Bacilli bacterium]|nr:stage II sporulation protein M [Bacilli bacterium]